MSDFKRTPLSAVEIQDEGAIQGNSSTLDFTGAGVTASVAAGKATINIPGGAGKTSEYISVFDGIHTTNNAAFVTAARLVINFAVFITPITLRWNQFAIPGGNAEVRFWNATDGVSLGSLVVNAVGLQSFAVNNPGGVKLVELQHRRIGGPGSSEIGGAVLGSV